MFSDDTPDAEIKLIDFGLSKVCCVISILHTIHTMHTMNIMNIMKIMNTILIASLLVDLSICTVWSALAITLLQKYS